MGWQQRQHWWQWWRRSLHIGLGVVLSIVLGSQLAISTPANQPPANLPPARSHPLPSTLVDWQDKARSGDYFDQVQPLDVGYLIWSQFPVSVYVQPPTATEITIPFTAKRAEAWVKAVEQAVQEWNQYLPLQLVQQAESADIVVWRSPPPLQITTQSSQTSDRRPGLPVGRVRSAETRFQLYTKPALAGAPLLSHRFTITLRPDQAPLYLLAAARHELGHAIGIWGHSPASTDALYFSQVRQPPPISRRDINTLKRVYEQPTRLGWTMPPDR